MREWASHQASKRARKKDCEIMSAWQILLPSTKFIILYVYIRCICILCIDVSNIYYLIYVYMHCICDPNANEFITRKLFAPKTQWQTLRVTITISGIWCACVCVCVYWNCLWTTTRTVRINRYTCHVNRLRRTQLLPLTVIFHSVSLSAFFQLVFVWSLVNFFFSFSEIFKVSFTLPEIYGRYKIKKKMLSIHFVFSSNAYNYI